MWKYISDETKIEIYESNDSIQDIMKKLHVSRFSITKYSKYKNIKKILEKQKNKKKEKPLLIPVKGQINRYYLGNP